MKRDLTVLFDGFGGVNIGAELAGVQVVRGFENDAEIAEVARKNLNHEIVLADILTVNPADYPKTWGLHASPPCPNFCLANAAGKESLKDIALADKISEFIKVMQPKVFTLENVYFYRKSISWNRIRNTLNLNGYWHDLAHVNAANFSVPQTRKRMIVRAVHEGWVPHLPHPEQWQGWYQAIEDLIPDLPESKFAPWQLARLPKNFSEVIDSFLVSQGDGINVNKDNPAFTITANRNQLHIRAFLMAGAGNTNTKDGYPMKGVIKDNDPSQTVTALQGGGTFPRAFIVSSQNKSGNQKGLLIQQEDQPMTTITASASKAQSRAWLRNGRVVKMTPRALARFQSFPDSYKLPERTIIACRGIGNAVPPLLYKKIIGGLI